MRHSKQEQKQPPDQGLILPRETARLVAPAGQVALCVPERDGGGYHDRIDGLLGSENRPGAAWPNPGVKPAVEPWPAISLKDTVATPATGQRPDFMAAIRPTPTPLHARQPQKAIRSNLTICKATDMQKGCGPVPDYATGQFAYEMDGGFVGDRTPAGRGAGCPGLNSLLLIDGSCCRPAILLIGEAPQGSRVPLNTQRLPVHSDSIHCDVYRFS